MPAPPWPRCATSSTSTTTCASSACSSTGSLRSDRGACCSRRPTGRASASSSSTRTPSGGGHERAPRWTRRALRAQRADGAAAEDALGRDGGERRAIDVRDLPRALQGLVRRQVGVGAGRARARCRGGRRGRRRLRARGADVAAADVGALRRVRPARDGPARARRAAQAGRLRRADVQPRHGSAAARARLARARRRDGLPRGDRAPGAVMDGTHHPFSAPPRELPRHRRGTAPPGRGRYPGYDILEEAGHWDEATRKVVLARVHDVPPVRFFDAREAATVGALADVLTAQDCEPRIPLVNFIDEKLFKGQGEGYRYFDMPDDRETWRRVVRGLDDEASWRGEAASFAAASDELQHQIVGDFADGKLYGGVWATLNVEHA